MAEKINMVHDVAYKIGDDMYQMVVEIPAGTNEKWQTSPETGEFYHDKKNGVPRIINYLPYPMNYGFIPQTILLKDKGGDGDPIDVVTLAPACPMGTVSQIKIVGAIQLSEKGETDTKIIATVAGGPFADVNDMADILVNYPGAIEIVRLWFEGYKGPGSFLFEGYASRQETIAIVEDMHKDWATLKRD